MTDAEVAYWKAEAEKWRALAERHEARARANAEAAGRLREEMSKTAAEKLAEMLDRLPAWQAEVPGRG